jgi:hypothetical protein
MVENAHYFRDGLPRPKNLARPSRFFLIIHSIPDI